MLWEVAGKLLLMLPALAIAASCVSGRAFRAKDNAQPPAAFDDSLVRKGAALARIGNCGTCHTARGGRSYAGGMPIETPFGTIYSTNITPDRETGIGNWSEAAFGRAMREGIDREGRHLYPAFPYDHFTRVTDEDNQALYAFIMTRLPVGYTPPANRLPFPFNVRAAIGLWKKLYFRPGVYQPDNTKSAAWNRGAYLAEGLGHCGSCHTPRNALGAEKPERHFQGGEAAGWHAYAIDASSASPVPWDQASLVAYLRNGWHERHGVSRGPMAPVTDNLAQVSAAEVGAIATYLLSLMGAPDAERGRIAESRARAADTAGEASAGDGAALYRGGCAGCHDGSQPLPFGGIPMALSIGVSGESPRNLVNVVLYGLPPAEGEANPVMPGYAGALTDAQVVTLVNHLRAHYSDKPPWRDVEKVVRESRAAGPAIAMYPAGGRK